MASKGKITEIVDVQACEKQLTELNNGLKIVLGTIEQVSKQALTMSNTFKEAKGIKDITTSTEKLNKVEADKLIAGEKLKQQMIATEKAELALTAAKTKAENATKKQTDAYAELTQKLKIAAREAQNAGIAHGQNSKEFKEAAAKAKALQTEVNGLNEAMGRHQGNVGNYRDAWTGVTKVFGTLMGVFAAGGAAMTAFNTIVESTDTLADKFAITLGGWKSGFAEIARSIASMDFEDFGKRIKNAIKQGQEYADEQDQLQDKERALLIKKATLERDIIDARVRGIKVDKDGVDALKEGVEKAYQLQKVEVEIAQFRLGVEMKAARQVVSGTNEVNDALDAQILAYINQDETLMKQLEIGQQYLDLQKKIRDAEMLNARGQAAGLPSNTAPADALKAQLSAMGESAAIYAEMVTNLGKLTVERDKIAESISAVMAAESEAGSQTIRMQSRIVSGEEKLTNTTETEEEKRVKAVKDAADEFDKISKEKYEKAKKETDDFAKFIKDSEITIKDATAGFDEGQIDDIINASMEEQKALNDAEIDLAAEKRDKLIEIYQQTYDGLMTLVNSQYSNQLYQIDQLAKADEEAKQKELKAAGDNKAAKDAIEAKYLAKEKEREAERIKIKMKQDKANKAAAMIKVIIDTALGIVSALSTVATAFMAPIIAAQGAIQLGVIAATPLPKYFKGREGGKAEFAMVGERGREAIQLSGGETFLTPDKPTVTWLPEHAKVITNEKLMAAAEMAAFRNMPSIGEQKTGSEMQIERLIDAINNKKEYHINLTEKGLQMAAKRGQNITEYLNKNVRI